jgi:hypothetical protein
MQARPYQGKRINERLEYFLNGIGITIFADIKKTLSICMFSVFLESVSRLLTNHDLQQWQQQQQVLQLVSHASLDGLEYPSIHL